MSIWNTSEQAEQPRQSTMWRVDRYAEEHLASRCRVRTRVERGSLDTKSRCRQVTGVEATESTPREAGHRGVLACSRSRRCRARGRVTDGGLRSAESRHPSRRRPADHRVVSPKTPAVGRRADILVAGHERAALASRRLSASASSDTRHLRGLVRRAPVASPIRCKRAADVAASRAPRRRAADAAGTRAWSRRRSTPALRRRERQADREARARPRADSTPIVPPWRSTISFTTASPMPSPPVGGRARRRRARTG